MRLGARGNPPNVLGHQRAGATDLAHEVPAPYGTIRLPIAGIVLDYSDQQGTILMDRAVFVHHWRDDSVNAFRLYLRAGAAVPDVKRRILERYDAAGARKRARQAFRDAAAKVRPPGWRSGRGRSLLRALESHRAVGPVGGLLGHRDLGLRRRGRGRRGPPPRLRPGRLGRDDRARAHLGRSRGATDS